MSGYISLGILYLFCFMSHLNIEIKARLRNAREQAAFIRNYLLGEGAEFKGTDEQTDTYFQVPRGRLKLREGRIENNLIYYERPDGEGPKASDFTLVAVDDPAALKQILSRTLGIRIVVKKIREIYYLGNVKFHIDEVPGLGHFTEIEAGNLLEDKSPETLRSQCDFYMEAFQIRAEDLVAVSYSDLML